MTEKRMPLSTILLATLLLLILNPVVSAEDSWVSKTEMPTARGYLQAAVVNGKIYAIGGSGPIGTNEEYDPETDTWTAKTPKPTPEQSYAIAVVRNKIYCIGGLPCEPTGVNEVYDPATDSWETKADMPTARYGLQANVVNGKIYCMGGARTLGYNQGVEELNVTEVYDPATDKWTTKSPMLSPAGYVSAVIDNKIYVIGPEHTQIYNPETDKWSTASSPSSSITAGGDNGNAAAAAATTGAMAPKRIYVYDAPSLQVYDPVSDSWSFGTSPPTNSRKYLAIAVVDDLLYFIGGFNFRPPGFYDFYAENEQYTPFGYGTPDSSYGGNELLLLVTVAVAVVVLVGAGLIVYFRKRHNNKPAQDNAAAAQN
jgi:hypothetical protein